MTDLTGKVFGMLTVVARSDRANTQGARLWICRCECGGETVTLPGHLRNGHTTSCGCRQRHRSSQANTTHGLAKRVPEYAVWVAMRKRCNRQANRDYKYYGARGIRVCDRWNDFEAFYSDMGPRPSHKHSIDRIDVDGNYEPANCRWADQTTQLLNRRPYERRAAS